MAETALCLWPVWFTDVNFGICGNDTLGRQTSGRDCLPGCEQSAWRECDLGRKGQRGLLWIIARRALTAFCRLSSSPSFRSQSAARVWSLLWKPTRQRPTERARPHSCMRWSGLPSIPSRASLPFSRGSRRLSCRSAEFSTARAVYYYDSDADADEAPHKAFETVESKTWLVPWRGLPHPLSEIEQRLAAMLGADGELAPLFRFNWLVDTVRGSRPRVDLVWTAGRLVVELDGLSGPFDAACLHRRSASRL